MTKLEKRFKENSEVMKLLEKIKTYSNSMYVGGNFMVGDIKAIDSEKLLIIESKKGKGSFNKNIETAKKYDELIKYEIIGFNYVGYEHTNLHMRVDDSKKEMLWVTKALKNTDGSEKFTTSEIINEIEEDEITFISDLTDSISCFDELICSAIEGEKIYNPEDKSFSFDATNKFEDLVKYIREKKFYLKASDVEVLQKLSGDYKIKEIVRRFIKPSNPNLKINSQLRVAAFSYVRELRDDPKIEFFKYIDDNWDINSFDLMEEDYKNIERMIKKDDK